MKKSKSSINLAKLYISEISEYGSDDVGNRWVSSKFIHTSYSRADMSLFKDKLLKFLKEKEFIDTKDISKFVENIARNSTINSVNQLDFFDNNSYKGRSLLRYFVSKSEVAEATERSKNVINSFIADVSKTKSLGTYKKADFIRRAELIAKCELAKITNLAVEKVAIKEGFTMWTWGASSSKTSRSSHEVLYGKKSKIGVSPAFNGEFPGELPNCKCKMIFVKE